MHGRWVSNVQPLHSLIGTTPWLWGQAEARCVGDRRDRILTRVTTVMTPDIPRVTTWWGLSHRASQRVSNTCRHTTAGWELAEVMWSAQLEQWQSAGCCMLHAAHTPVIMSNRHWYWFIVREWSTEQAKCSLMSELTLNLQKCLQSSTSITQKLHISVSWQIGLQSGRHLHQRSSGGI